MVNALRGSQQGTSAGAFAALTTESGCGVRSLPVPDQSDQIRVKSDAPAGSKVFFFFFSPQFFFARQNIGTGNLLQAAFSGANLLRGKYPVPYCPCAGKTKRGQFDCYRATPHILRSALLF